MTFRATAPALRSHGLYLGNLRSPNWFPSLRGPISNTFLHSSQRSFQSANPPVLCPARTLGLVSPPQPSDPPCPVSGLSSLLFPSPLQRRPQDAARFFFGSATQEIPNQGLSPALLWGPRSCHGEPLTPGIPVCVFFVPSKIVRQVPLCPCFPDEETEA